MSFDPNVFDSNVFDTGEVAAASPSKRRGTFYEPPLGRLKQRRFRFQFLPIHLLQSDYLLKLLIEYPIVFRALLNMYLSQPHVTEHVFGLKPTDAYVRSSLFRVTPSRVAQFGTLMKTWIAESAKFDMELATQIFSPHSETALFHANIDNARLKKHLKTLIKLMETIEE